MRINDIERPWMKSNKRSSDSWYNTKQWKQVRHAFIQSPPHVVLPNINGRRYTNAYCIDCWKEGRITPMHTVDHTICINDGGSRTDFNNMTSKCESHNASKTARDGNNRRNKKQ